MINTIDREAGRDLAKLREEFPYVFRDKVDRNRCKKPPILEMRLEVDEKKYRCSRFYCVLHRLQEHALPILQEWEDNGVIKRCKKGPFCAPLLVVSKKGGKYRPCVDYRDLNDVTTPFPYPLPRIDTIKQDIRGVVFSALDLKDAFHQVPVAREDRYKTAVRTPKGLYMFRVMPFGLKNAPGVFQYVADVMLDGLEDCCVVYIDDILVFSMSYQQHIKDLRRIMERLDKYGMKLNVEKSQFFKTTVEFLGLELSANGYRPLVDYMPKIENFERPQTKKGVMKFLGLVGYYRSS